MPQLDTATYLSQAFWLIVCFCTLWGLLSVFITPKLTDIIEQRKRKISDYVQKAEKLNNQAKEILESYQSALSRANQNVSITLAEGKAELQAQMEQTQRKMMEELNQEIAEREQALLKEKKQTTKQIENMSYDMALAIVKKLGFAQITRQDIINAGQKDKQHG
ncbi:MAG: hypothetical protein J6Y91_02945 [Alphaproteobacteria bacterium]|nr:hypothetical protein [Alphaproteobacteria bacterium]